MKKFIWIVIIVLGLMMVGWGLLTLFFTTPESVDDSEPKDGEPSVNIQAEFPEKIVYTTDASVDTEPLQAHCAYREGTFNTCGSVCGPDAEICPSVCAFTCEL